METWWGRGGGGEALPIEQAISSLGTASPIVPCGLGGLLMEQRLAVGLAALVTVPKAGEDAACILAPQASCPLPSSGKHWEKALLRKAVVSDRLQRLLQPKLLK